MAWMDLPPVNPPKRLMKVTVTTDTGRRFETTGRYASSFAAYDEALDRHPNVARIEVLPMAEVQEVRHA